MTPTKDDALAALDVIAASTVLQEDHYMDRVEQAFETIRAALTQPRETVSTTMDYVLIAPVAHYFNGDAEKTRLWFETPNPNLGGVKPIDTPRDRLLKFITEQTSPQPTVDVEGVMKPVVIESPFAGDTEGNRAYLYECCLDCLRRNESPYASHGFFVHFLDDLNPAERKLGIDAGLAWSDKADIVAVYTDRGISNGMKYAIDRHKKNGKTIEYRSLK